MMSTEVARLLWAVRVRWLVIGGFFVLAAVARMLGEIPALMPCVAAAALGCALNALNHWCVARARWLDHVTALALPGDVILITYVVRATGDVQSPFVMMYVVQVVATAMLVGVRAAAASALGSVVLFVGALLWDHRGWPAIGERGLVRSPLLWAAFLLYCLGLLAFLGGYISARLRRSERDLEAQAERMRALGQFVAGIAHELNNPISVVAANLEHLRQYVEPLRGELTRYHGEGCGGANAGRDAVRCAAFVADLPDLWRDCEEGLRRAAEIVASLRAFAHSDPPQARRRIDVHDALDRSLALIRLRLGPEVRVERAYGDVPLVTCVPGELDQVFLNLFLNAAAAVGARGSIRVETRCVDGRPGALRGGSHVAIRVTDDGGGIPSAVLAHIFEPFFTTKAVGEGTGLGLSVSYGIVERHGGIICADSAPGRGSTFTIYLPLAGGQSHG